MPIAPSNELPEKIWEYCERCGCERDFVHSRDGIYRCVSCSVNAVFVFKGGKIMRGTIEDLHTKGAD